MRCSVAHVPHYRRLFREIGVNPNDPDPLTVLRALPILRKAELRENEAAFRAERLPETEKVGSVAKSSGTTGIPVGVLHTVRSKGMFGLLKQREYRWFRFDPDGTMAIIRPLPQRTPSAFRFVRRYVTGTVIAVDGGMSRFAF